jgi:hypothetical protein
MACDIDGISFWRDSGADAVTLHGTGVATERDSYVRVRLLQSVVADSGLPPDLTDWCVVVTTTDGDHLPHSGVGEIAECTHQSGHVRLKFPTQTMTSLTKWTP